VLAPTAALIAVLQEASPFALEDAVAEAKILGRKGWAKPIERSLSQIGAAIP
jgi:hypothetical protein